MCPAQEMGSAALRRPPTLPLYRPSRAKQALRALGYPPLVQTEEFVGALVPRSCRRRRYPCRLRRPGYYELTNPLPRFHYANGRAPKKKGGDCKGSKSKPAAAASNQDAICYRRF